MVRQQTLKPRNTVEKKTAPHLFQDADNLTPQTKIWSNKTL